MPGAVANCLPRRRTAQRRLLARRNCTVVASAAAAWLVLQLGLSAVVDRWAPEMRDPEFGNKLARLREGQRNAPQQPLVVVIGSSRADYGVCPAAIGAYGTAGEMPRVFNFGMMGAGPITQLIALQELLAAGVRPDGALIEINPLLLHQAGGFCEQAWLHAERLDFAGLHVLRRYSSRPWGLCCDWLRMRLTPCYALRFLLLGRFAPAWLEPTVRQDRRTPPDLHGWLPHEPPQVTAEDRRWRIGRQLEQYSAAFHDFQISESPDRALHELLDVCRRRQISVGLLLMPEASEFRDALGEAAARRLQGYVDELQREYQLSVFDARSWVKDGDFADGEHLLPDAARSFTRRLCQAADPLLAEICLKCNRAGPGLAKSNRNSEGIEFKRVPETAAAERKPILQ